MWQLDNRTSFAAERAWTRGRDGAEIWLVAVKCTFDITPDGRTKLAAEQPPVARVPEYVDPSRPGGSSLKFDADLVRTKATTDVLVLGHAHAPRGEPATVVDVGVVVGPVRKQLRVTGDRVWRGTSMSAPQPFTKMPIVYERAFGGVDPSTASTDAPQWDPRNPVGTGFCLSDTQADGVRLPNVEYPDQLITRPKHRPTPAGFGAICSHWQPRATLAGTYDATWEKERFPLVPADFDDRHYQCAPADQQAAAFLKGGEPVVLVNLTPGGVLRFELPRVFLGFETFFRGSERRSHDKATLHTILIDADALRVSLVWHTALPCHPKVYKLEKTRVFEKQVIQPFADRAELIAEGA